MTIEEINNLSLEEHREMMANRLWGKIDPRPEEMPEFNDAEISAEFEIYKSELIAKENERLRIEDLKTRFNSLKDMRLAFHTLHNEPNPALWLKGVLSLPASEAEAKIAELEAKDVELEPSAEEVAKADWAKDIEAELKKENLTKDGLLEALVRKEFLGDTSLVDAIKPKIQAINSRKPRP